MKEIEEKIVGELNAERVASEASYFGIDEEKKRA